MLHMNVFSSMVIRNKINAKKTETKNKRKTKINTTLHLYYLQWVWDSGLIWAGKTVITGILLCNREIKLEREREKSVRKLQAEDDEQEKENESDKR